MSQPWSENSPSSDREGWVYTRRCELRDAALGLLISKQRIRAAGHSEDEWKGDGGSGITDQDIEDAVDVAEKLLARCDEKYPRP